jgi:hypothetical protein
VKLTVLLAPAAVVTCAVAAPVAVPAGMVKQICESLQGKIEVIGVPFSVSVLLPCESPNPLPFTHCLPPTGMLAFPTELIAGTDCAVAGRKAVAIKETMRVTRTRRVFNMFLRHVWLWFRQAVVLRERQSQARGNETQF